MATGSFFNSLGYRFWVKKGTTASTVPTASTGLVEVLSLTNAGIQTRSDTTDVLDYGSSQGFKASIITGNSYSIPCEMNLDLRDAGYKELKDAAINAASGVTVQWFRESPEMTASGNPETHAGVAFVADFNEQIQAGNVARISFTLQGYGSLAWSAETDAA